MPTGRPFDLDSAEFLADPFPLYARLRREAPVCRARLSYAGDADFYLLARYRDCVDLTTDHRFRRVVAGAEPLPMPKAIRFMSTDSMILKDDPEHLRLRKLVSRAFTPKAVARLTDRVEEVTNELLAGFEPGRQIELINDYALPIPVTVISEMVGVDEADRSQFHDGMTLVMEGIAKYGIDETAARMEPLIDLIRGMIEHRRAAPAEDIMTGLIHASEDGDSLSDDEVVAMVFLLVVAGYETTYNLIGNAIATLLTHRGQLASLQAQPDLIGSAVEEVLRLHRHHRRYQAQLRRPGRRVARCHDSAGRAGHPAAGLGQPRPRCVRQTRRLRHHPQPQSPHRVQQRRAFLPRRQPRAHGDPHRRRQPRHPIPRPALGGRPH